MSVTKNLQHFVISSWLMSGLMAIVASLVLFSLLGYYSYTNETKISQNELNDKTQTLARRISGELLIAPRGSPDAVALQLQKEMKLSDVQFGAIEAIKDIKRQNGFLYSEVKIPFLESKYSVLAATPIVKFWKHFNLSNLIISVGLTGLIIGSGLYFQTRYFKKYLIQPIESLVDTSTGDRAICEKWPQEIKEISQKLNSSFQQREQVVYNQIARGVIHDAKTILQSLQVATDLASEAQTEIRLKNLLKVSREKLPSLLSIIDTTLDGSREIKVLPATSNLLTTIQKSISTCQSLPVAQRTNLTVEELDQSIMLAHDPIQMERVFTNLLKNAFEAVESKNQTEKKVNISFNLSDKDFIGIQIEDSGVGLPAKSSSIFRLLKSTKTHGSGLGLLVSKKIVEAHKGHLTATHSIELGGAKFEVKLPMEATV